MSRARYACLEMVGRAPRTTQVGTKDAGARITCAPGGKALRAEVWGYWTPEIASAFTREAVAACRKVSTPLDFVLDATALKPQGREGQASLHGLMKLLGQLNLSRARISTDNILTKMQLLRLTKDSGIESLLSFEADAAGE